MKQLWRTVAGPSWRWLVAVLGVALLLAACGGGADRTKARIRLVNASGYAGLDLTVDDTRRFSSVAYGASADFAEVDPDQTASTIASAGSATALLSFTPTLARNKAYTLLAYGAQGSLKQLLLDENTSEPDSGKALLRVVNAAPDAGTLDVYVTGADDPLASAVPLQSDAASGATGSYVMLNAATWRVRVTGADSSTDLRLDLSGISLASKQVATLVLTAGSGGVLVNALLLTQEGAITRSDNSQARVRVAAVVTDNGAVDASVAGKVLLTGGALAVTEYTLVSAGSAAVSVAVNGVPSASTAALTAGADYTMMVYGAPSAPVLSWIADDNLPPRTTSSARLRLVHGVADLATALSMTSDFLPVAQGVAPGQASSALTLAASTTAGFTVTTPGRDAAVYAAVDRVLEDGGVYTLFVVGKLASPTGILRRDR